MYILDTDNGVIVNGHFKLELIPGKLYDIRHGINQGAYKYIGRVIVDDENDSAGAFVFENENGERFIRYSYQLP